MKDLDTSYSGVVSQIQGDKRAAKKLALQFITEMRISLKAKEASEKEVERHQMNAGLMKQGLDNISRHLKIKGEFYVVGQDAIYEINKEGVIENSNVLK